MSEMSSRVQRVADQIQRELAMLIQMEVNDPRIGMVSVTSVSVSRDLGHANVYVTVLNTMTGSD
jgi:ribosome-binding factor A